MSAYNLESLINQTPQGMNISKIVLTNRQLKAGLCVLEDEDWITLTTKGGTVIARMGIHTDRELIQNEADRYLKEIDWQE